MNTRDETAPAPTPAAMALMRRTPYDRHEWEDAVLGAGLHSSVRLVALALAHHAGPGGHLQADGVQHTGRMGARTGLTPERVRDNFRLLEKAGFIWRPEPDRGHSNRVRPITLTVPVPRPRGELPNTGEVPK